MSVTHGKKENGLLVVIASAAKQSRAVNKTGLLRRFAPRNDDYICGATRFSTFTPSRASMISAIHCRWQCR